MKHAPMRPFYMITLWRELPRDVLLQILLIQILEYPAWVLLGT